MGDKSLRFPHSGLGGQRMLLLPILMRVQPFRILHAVTGVPVKLSKIKNNKSKVLISEREKNIRRKT